MEKMEALLDRHFINGELVPPVQGQYLDVVDPAEESLWGRSAAGTNSPHCVRIVTLCSSSRGH